MFEFNGNQGNLNQDDENQRLNGSEYEPNSIKNLSFSRFILDEKKVINMLGCKIKLQTANKIMCHDALHISVSHLL